MIGYNNLQLNNFNITLGYGDESERTGLYLCLGICSGVYLLGRTITYPVSISTLYSIVAIDSASGMDAVQVCDVNTANNTSAIIFQMRLTKGDILPDNMTGFYWILIGKAQQWGTYPGNHTLTFAVAFSVPWVLVLNGLTGTAEDRLDTETTLQPNTNVLSNDDPPGGYYIAIGQQQIKRQH